jgi:YfiH family protein
VTESKSPFLTVPKLLSVPGLIHGFGEARWSEADFLAFAEDKGMKPVIMRQLHSDIIHRLPVLLVDPENRAVAAVHCGWRGTEKRLLEKAIKAMSETYGSQPSDMLAALGPCIGAACYEVGPEVRKAFLEAGFPGGLFVERGKLPAIQVPNYRGKYLLDLRAANLWLLREAGVPKSRVFNSGPVCTHCEPRLLSYRRHPADPRRMYNFIGFEEGR